MIDYHVHTQLCNHATGSMNEYIHKAIDLGFKEICFLDHLIVKETPKKLSMSLEDVPIYFQAVQNLKYKYQADIDIKVGLEIDFDPKHMDEIQNIVQSFSFDVIGCSIHFLGFFDIVSSDSEWKQGNIDPEFMYDLYLSQLYNMLDYDCFDMICHIDLIKKFGHKSIRPHDREFAKIIEKIKQLDLTVEFNTGGYTHQAGESYPSPDLLDKLNQAGIPITIGSDSHKPSEVGRFYDEAFEVLDANGYRYLASFSKRKRRMIPID